MHPRQSAHSSVPAEALLRSTIQRSSSGGDVETVCSVPFLFTTLSPIVLQAVAPGQVLNRASILITQTFDDPTAKVLLGTSGFPSNVLEVPGKLGQFESSVLFPFATGDLLILTIMPGTSSQGSGVLLYKVK